jgi:DNA modification methylase
VSVIITDCVAGLRGLPPGSVDLIVADPPYNIGIDYGDGAADDLRSPQEYIAWTREWVGAAADALAEDGSMWVICGHEYAGDHQIAMRDAGLHWRNTVTWHETFGVNCRRKFSRTSRPCFWFTRHRSRFTFHADEVTVESVRQQLGDRRASPSGKVMGDVWQISRVCGTFHERVAGVPTQLPLALVERIVRSTSSPGDRVVDPFTGSGTTGVVCALLDRVFTGFEVRECFAEIARGRIEGAA